MRKLFMIVVVMLCVAVTSAWAYTPYPDEELSKKDESFEKQITIGTDSSGMTWYLIDYGPNRSGFYAVARKYYTNRNLKASTVDTLISRFSVPERIAKDLFFTEYRYEYTADGLRYAEAYRRYYDSYGNKIIGLEFDGRSTARRKTFINVVKNTIQSKGLAYASGRLVKHD